ncbi:hypothetical protein [Brenneria uluponensis]|uniref:hypothetical protein n=1 Tax=Brenneria uluponensis TaxID=3057057 RepID=UPI0028EEDA41|nr:hypothetical protein [Brenneria ulupoensis]
MKAVRLYGIGDLRVESVAEPAIAAGQVRLWGLVAPSISLDAVPQTYDHLIKGKSPYLKPVIRP